MDTIPMKTHKRDHAAECEDASLRLIDELERRIKSEKDESARLRLTGQLNAIKSFAPADFGIPCEFQGNWLGFLYPSIDEKGTLHFTFCSRDSDLPGGR